MKECILCKVTKDLNQFSKDKTRGDGYNTKCKNCNKSYRDSRKGQTSEYWAQYYLDNKEEHNDRVNRWYDNNPDYRGNYYNENKHTINKNNKQRYIDDPEPAKLRSILWNIRNPERVKKNKRDYENNKVKINPQYKLTKSIRYNIWRSLKSILGDDYYKSKRTEEILGCTFEEFKIYIESLFEPWMNWENKGDPKDGILEFNKNWDLDHITPSSSACNEEEIIRLNHYTNFQPLCSKVNREIKRNRLSF